MLERHWRTQSVVMSELGKVVQRSQVRNCSVLSRAGCGHTSPHSLGSGSAHPAQGSESSVSQICSPWTPITLCRATAASDEKEQAAADTIYPGSRNIHGRMSNLPWERDSLPNTTGYHVPAGQDMAEACLCVKSCLFLHYWVKKK